MVRKYFGTDGIRGKANEGAMTAETALRVGMAAGRVFRRGDHRHRVVIGKDTRLSGYMLEPALTAGFTSMGMDVFLFGPLPTTYRKNKRPFHPSQQLWTAVDSFDTPAMQPNPADGEPATLKIYPPLSH
ncbi:phosphoglucosamine mutase (plasmid) [Escherichia coli]|nr:phosphoglucosamine mutase [Escherichia coli]